MVEPRLVEGLLPDEAHRSRMILLSTLQIIGAVDANFLLDVQVLRSDKPFKRRMKMKSERLSRLEAVPWVSLVTTTVLPIL